MLILKKTEFQIMGSEYVQKIPVCQKLRLQIDLKIGRYMQIALAVSTAAPVACSSDLVFVSWSQSEKG